MKTDDGADEDEREEEGEGEMQGDPKANFQGYKSKKFKLDEEK